MENTAKLFICNHPSQLFLYKNFIEIIREYDQNSKIILFKVNHPYFLKFNFKPYEKYFDEIIEFEFINYKKNFLTGFWKIFSFQNKLKKIDDSLLLKFDKIDLFLHDSAWLPVNILLYNLARQKNIKNINRFNLGTLECSQTKKDSIKTLLYSLYSLPFKCYKVKVISTLAGQFQDFVYTEQVAGTIVRIVGPSLQTLNNPDWGKENILPYPITAKHPKDAKKDMIIIFGNADIFQCYSEYLPEHETFVKKMTSFFEALESKYSNYKLYYKPHPCDENRVMPGIDLQKYNLFDNTVDAPILINMYQERIRAVYTFSSTSIMIASFFGIPSYTFYQYVLNQAGIELFDNIFNQDDVKSEFLFNIADLSKIGKIDNLESVNHYIDLKNVDEKYLKVLNV